ncbi:ankyrin [Piromyces finnis]|uniref:Ankyrin n=1 Tax=Piromyces finnis TaxID=1754191 RepID=A0A1Y1UZA2_9FUNG|nr:ankyrin [Piromyces finnis]|eukprot:ORX43291.1 ankyrin [Piromyces finnis]
MEGLQYLIKNNRINDIKSYITSHVIKSNEVKNNTFDLLIDTIKSTSSLGTLKTVINIYQYLYKNLNYSLDSGESPLAVALSLNNFTISNFLIEQKADINYCNRAGDSILFYLYKENLLGNSALKYILDHDVEINKFDSNNKCFLAYILENNNQNLIKILFSKFKIYSNDFIIKLINLSKLKNPISHKDFQSLFDIENVNTRKLQITKDILARSCTSQSLDVLKLLFEDNNVNKEFFASISNKELICNLYLNNKKDILKFLVEKGAKLNESYYNTLFLHIINSNDIDMAEYIISKGAFVNVKADYPNLIIWKAYQLQHNEMAKLIIRHGADLNIPDTDYEEILEVANSDENILPYLKKYHNVKNYNNSTLLYACKNGNTKIVKHLLQTNVHFNEIDEDIHNTFDYVEESALIYACKIGNDEIVQLLVDKGANVNYKYSGTYTPLVQACIQGYDKIAKILLENGATIEPEIVRHSLTDKKGDAKSTLMYACENGNKKIVEYLIQYGANVNEKNLAGETPLMCLCKNRHQHLIEYFIENNANINDKDNYGNTALMYACQEGMLDIVKLLIDYHVKINDQNVNGETALIIAIVNGATAVAKLLLQYHADPNIIDNSRKSPLMYALKCNQKEIVSELLLHPEILREDIINNTTVKHKTLLMYSCKYNDKSLVEQLINHQANLTIKNSKGETAMIYACKYGHNDIVEYLISQGGCVDDTSENGDSCLIFACQHGYKYVAKHLIKNNCQVNTRGFKGKTALMYACENGKMDLVELLVLNNVNINKRDMKGKTALMYAAEYNQIKIVEYLVEHQADIGRRDELGNTALMYACQGEYKEVIKCLVKHDSNVDQNGGRDLMILICSKEKSKIESDDKDVIKLLIKKGVDVNAKDIHDTTILMLACGAYGLETIEYLVENGANINAKNDNGDTALKMAIKYKNDKVIDFLKEKIKYSNGGNKTKEINSSNNHHNKTKINYDKNKKKNKRQSKNFYLDY